MKVLILYLIQELKYVSGELLETYLLQLSTDGETILQSTVVDAVRNNIDVKPGVIEGGFTVWDGSKDLVQFICTHMTNNFANKSVLELGCGCGLPGILAAKLGAKLVRFQDYNPDVLKYWTIPNVHLNLNSISLSKTNIEFFSGDWNCLMMDTHWATSNKFDYIITSETIYRVDLYSRLLRVMLGCLNPTGQIIMACKSSYGPGGNLSDFLTYVSSQNVFDVELHEINLTGVIRFVVQMKHRSK